MPLELALRPRFRIAEGFAPPRRSRFRLPKLALPILAYWLAAGGVTYELIHLHDQPNPPEEATLTPEPIAAQPIVAALAPEPTATEPTAAAIATEPTTVPTAPAPLDEPASPTRAARSNDTDDERAAAPIPPAAPMLAPTLAPTPSEPQVGDSVASCEAAAAAANQDLDFAQRERSADLSRESIAAVLDDGAWLGTCRVSEATAIDVCVAISAGKVRGATVVSRPASSTLSACIKRRAAALRFPYSPRLDLARTHFDAH